MTVPYRMCALAALVAVSCAHGNGERQTANRKLPAPPATAAFEPALAAIRSGEIDRILAMRGEASDSKMGDFLRQLYVRYGDVERIATLAIERAGPVSRGAFLAEHEFGPFVWELITDGLTFPLVHATSDLTPYLRTSEAPSGAAVLATQVLDGLNAGRATEVFPLLVCRCMTEAEFRRQVAVLVQNGGTETARSLVRSETITGLEDKLVVMHFLSERSAVRLGFHLTLWKVGDGWRINAINWTQEELLPAPRVSQSSDGHRQPPAKVTAGSLPLGRLTSDF
jgi:hypothetical protein